MITSENNQQIEISMTDEAKKILEERKIYFAPNNRYPASIIVPKTVYIEEYAHFPVVSYLYTNGSFSYIHTGTAHHGLKVGRYTSISSGFSLFGERHPSEWATQSPFIYHAGYPAVAAGRRDLLKNPTKFRRPTNRGYFGATIGNDVWIGQNVQVAQKVVIGDGAIVAAGSVVTKDVAPYAVVAGVPARPIKMRFADEICALLLQSEWWNFHPADWEDFDIEDPKSFAGAVLEARYNGRLRKFSPRTTTWSDLKGDFEGINGAARVAGD